MSGLLFKILLYAVIAGGGARFAMFVFGIKNDTARCLVFFIWLGMVTWWAKRSGAW